MGRKIVEEAASWDGTPYKFRARIKGVGADCASYLHCVWLKFFDMPPMPPGYRESDIMDADRDYFLDYIETCCYVMKEPVEGCGVLFKVGKKFSHAGFVDEHGYVWHCWGRNGFAGVTRSPWSRFRVGKKPREHIFWMPRPEFLRE